MPASSMMNEIKSSAGVTNPKQAKAIVSKENKAAPKGSRRGPRSTKLFLKGGSTGKKIF